MNDLKKQRYIFLAVINGVCLIAFAVLTAVLFSIKGSLPSQHMVERWSKSDEQRFSQLSVFYSPGSAIDLNTVYTMRVNIDKKLTENSVEALNPNARKWFDAYSTPACFTVSSSRSDYTVSVEANCIATGGDYFLFHPLKLLSGSYYSDSDLMQDRVILDENLAWQLFGSNDIVGMTVVINNRRFYVAGVVKPDGDSASEYTYGSKPVMYISYAGLSSLLGDAVNLITAYEVCLPNPVTGLAEKILTEVSGIKEDDNTVKLINNSQRYSLKKLLEIAFDNGSRAVIDSPVIYPFWENAARMTEERAASALLAAVIMLIIPTMTVLFFIIKLVRRRKMLFKAAVKRISVGFNRIKFNLSRGKAEKTT